MVDWKAGLSVVLMDHPMVSRTAVQTAVQKVSRMVDQKDARTALL
jgi:hypothetical protein